MKIKSQMLLLAFGILIFLGNFAYAQTSFEGKIKLQVSDEGEKNTIEYLVKGERIRLEIANDDAMGSMIFDAKKRSMMILMPQQKMYMEIDLNLTGADSYFEGDSYQGNIKRTGEKKIIKGYECEKWIAEEDGQIIESWLTDQLGGFMFYGNPMEGTGSDWKSKLSTPNLFPLMVNVFESGKMVSSIEVLEINPQKLENSVFLPPSGFQRFEMPSINIQKTR